MTFAAERLLKDMKETHDITKVWVVKLDQNYWDWLSRLINVCISVVHGRPKWQHASVLIKFKNSDTVHWIEYLWGGVTEFVVNFDSDMLPESLNRSVYCYYDLIYPDDEFVMSLVTRMELLQQHGVKTSWWRYLRYLFTAESNYDLVCTTFASYLLNNRFDERIYSPAFKVGPGENVVTVETTINLSDWRDPHAA